MVAELCDVDNRRTVSSVKLEDEWRWAAHATEYVVKAEAELPEVRDGILEVMDEDLISLASTGELMALYSRMKGDYYRHTERVVAMPVPQIMEEITEVIRLVSQERIHERIVEETIDVPISRVMEEAIEVEQASKLNSGCAVQAPEWEEIRGPRDEELMTTWDINKLLNDCDELILKWLNSVKGVVDSEGLPLNIYRETLLQNKISRVIKQKHVTKCLEILAAIAELKDAYRKFYEQLVKCMKLENSVDGVEIAEVLRFNTSKSGGEEISLKEYADRIKEEQNDICYINGESITVVSSSPFSENLHMKGHEVPYMADPVDECAVHQFKEFGGKMLKSATKEGLDLGDDDEKNKIEELKTEFKLPTKLMKDVLGDKAEVVIVSDRIVDSPCVLTTSEYGWSAKMERIMEAQALRDNSMTSCMVSKKTMEVNPAAWQQQHSSQQPQTARQATQQEREGGKKEKSEKVEGGEWEAVVGKKRKEDKRGAQEGEERKKGQEGRKKEEEREAKEGGSEQVKKDVTGWTEVTRRRRKKMIQIFVRVNESKAISMEVSLTDDKVEDVLRQVQNVEDTYVTLHGRVLKRSEMLKSCGVADGCTIQVERWRKI